ncbi:MAG: T9SS type A sorting domain-containing protein [Bacteroidota bacterium]
MTKFRTIYRCIIGLAMVFCSTRAPAQISSDAIELTLRVQEGIMLDSLWAQKIDSSLIIARLKYDTLNSIHARRQYVISQLLISTSAEWSEAWRRLELLTGDTYIDSLGKVYGLVKADTGYRASGFYILTFKTPLQMQRLSALYAKHRGVNFAEPNGYGGDANNIEYFRKNNIDHFAFSYGSGDCPAGCIYRYYWYVTVSGTGSARNALLEEGGARSGVKIYRWNIPPRYAMTMFPNLDSILTAIQYAPEWWVRKHAIEGSWRFFVRSSPWVGEDLIKRWDTLKFQIQSRKNDILNVLKTAQNDVDPDVRASAEFAVNTLKVLNVTPDVQNVFDFTLFQNFPNPFNPSTQIQFHLAHETAVSLKVFTMLGQEVTSLVNSTLTAGVHSFNWNAERFSSGIYYYTLRVGKYSESKKMLLLK